MKLAQGSAAVVAGALALGATATLAPEDEAPRTTVSAVARPLGPVVRTPAGPVAPAASAVAKPRTPRLDPDRPEPFVPIAGVPLRGSKNPLDQAVLARLQGWRIEPAPIASASEFVRRLHADAIGRVPGEPELALFESGPDTAERRDALVDELLASDEYAAHWARNLAEWLCLPRWSDERTAIEATLASALRDDAPLADLVRALADGPAARPSPFQACGAPFGVSYPEPYRAVDRLVETFAGVASRCARCHDHKLTSTPANRARGLVPAEYADDDPAWTQAETFGLYAFFARSAGEATRVDFSGEPRREDPTQPAFVLDGASRSPKDLPSLATPLAERRRRFGELLASSDAFVLGTAHRVFAEVVDPIFDPNRITKHSVRIALPAVQNFRLRERLVEAFRSSGTRLRPYLRTIFTSKLYQLTTDTRSMTDERVRLLDQCFGRRRLRRHHGEVVGSALANLGVDRWVVTDQIFRDTFGMPVGDFITERRDDANASHLLILANHRHLSMKAAWDLAAALDARTIAPEEAVRQLFRRALARDPEPEEVAAALAARAPGASHDEWLEDVCVALRSSIEFSNR